MEIEATRREVNRCKNSTVRLDIRVIKNSTYLYEFYAIMTRYGYVLRERGCLASHIYE